MVDRPTEFPEWASNPPANTITSPTSLQREEGDQPGSPRRQFHNWKAELVHRWTQWADQITTRNPGDYMPPHALPGGTPPVTGAGLVIAAAAFTARVVADGYLVGPISSPAYTYSANSDTYWDLSRAGTWTPVVVASGAGEPAVTANSTRAYVIRTNATDRTVFTDRRAARVRFRGDELDFDAGVRFGFIHPAIEPRISLAYRNASSEVYSHLMDFPNTDGTTVQGRLYIRGTGGAGNGLELVYVVGAHYTQGVGWTATANNPTRIDFGNRRLRTMEATGIFATNVFADSRWLDATLSDLQTRNDGGFILGLGLVGTDAAIQLDFSASTAAYDEILTEPITGASIYSATPGLGGSVPAFVFTINARYDNNGSVWNRTTGNHAWRLELSRDSGLRLFRHNSASASPWADTIGSGTWEQFFAVDANGLATVLGGVTAGGNLTVAGTGAVAGMLTSDDLITGQISAELLLTTFNVHTANVTCPRNTLKAWGRVVSNGAAGITYSSLHGCTVSISGSILRVTFTTAMIDADSYAVVASFANDGGGVRTIRTTNRLAASVDLQVADASNVVVNFGANANYEISFHIFGNV